MMLVGVSDSGPGIPAEEQHRLFEKFQQIPSVVGRRSGTGLGLGLPFCKLAVEAHGGQIWAESEVGKGSTFMMRLPVSELALNAGQV
jgi:signal transduction histidine kinase